MSKYETNIAAIRQSAITLLYIDIMPTRISFVASHPFTDSYIVAVVGKDNMPEFIDLREPENVKTWREEMKKQIEKMNLFEIFMLMNKPYRLFFLHLNRKNISDSDLGESLASNWAMIENISTDVNISGKKLVALFKRADKKKLMNEEEWNIFQSIGNEITLYRGVTAYNKKYEKAMSWTRDYEKAKWFATRYGQNGEVWRITVPKERVLACFEQCSESEVVLNLYGSNYLIEKERIEP